MGDAGQSCDWSYRAVAYQYSIHFGSRGTLRPAAAWVTWRESRIAAAEKSHLGDVGNMDLLLLTSVMLGCLDLLVASYCQSRPRKSPRLTVLSYLLTIAATVPLALFVLGLRYETTSTVLSVAMLISAAAFFLTATYYFGVEWYERQWGNSRRRI